MFCKKSECLLSHECSKLTPISFIANSPNSDNEDVVIDRNPRISGMEDQIFRADKRLRNQVIFGIVIFAALGIQGIQWLSFFLDRKAVPLLPLKFKEGDPVDLINRGDLLHAL